LKASNATSAPNSRPQPSQPAAADSAQTATGAAPPKSGNPPSPIVDGFALSGVSNLPDPTTNAFRKDLADTALAGRVIASHYAEPLARRIAVDAPLFRRDDDAGEPIAMLRAGAILRMLDCSRGWAWGYAPDGQVGYVRADAVGC
jgi:hypothetical protein